MVQLSKIAKVSFVAVIFSVMKVSAYIGKSSTSVLQNDAGIDQEIDSKTANSSDTLESFAEHLSSHFVNHVISALQNESVSFIQSESTFDFKAMAKEQALNLVKEVLKTSLQPVEEAVSEAVDPPHLQRSTSTLVKAGLKEIFNKAEHFAGVKVPDSVWKIKGKADEEGEDEEEEESEEGEEEESEEEESEEGIDD